MTKKTKINGYEVTLEIDTNADPSTECWVEKGFHSGSLAMLELTGELLNSSDMELTVPDSIIDKISKWAEANA